MKISYAWLQEYFEQKLPAPEKISEALTFHAFEIESVEKVDEDSVIDVKVTPNRGHDALSHRGIAKEISAILNIPIAKDPLRGEAKLEPISQELTVTIENPQLCRRYSAAVIKGVAVKQSPVWLQRRLEALGQRPINNIVDATNFIMFNLGEPLHAFDIAHMAEKDGNQAIFVRNAAEGETIETLEKTKRTLTPSMLLIADGVNSKALGIAGIKGGRAAEIGEKTRDIVIEAANFNGVSIRKSAKALALRTDASTRFEHELSPELTPHALREVVEIILKIAGGELEGYADVYPQPQKERKVTTALSHANKILGLALSGSDVEDIFVRLDFAYERKGEEFTVTPPFERLDIEIAEDLIEEVGRIKGYGDLPAVIPEPIAVAEYNKTLYYSDKIRETLRETGFSEIFTSSFREKGSVAMLNAFASDKNHLRKDLKTNMEESLARNIHHADLLGLSAVRVFEIGAVFPESGEELSLCVGVRHQNGKKQKGADDEAAAALAAVGETLGGALSGKAQEGIVEVNLDEIFKKLPAPSRYEPRAETPKIRYQTFSSYPYIVRDIALWASKGSEKDIEAVIKKEAGTLLVRLGLFDVFEKDARTSYAYRLIFQSYEKTLQDSEVNAIMERVTGAMKERKWEVR